MNYADVLKQLESLGTAQNRKVYARHGVGGTMFGVSYANQNALAKKIKRDHDLAIKLWDSGNHDAHILATFIADPESLTATQLNSWVRDLNNYVLADALSKLVGQRVDVVKLADRYAKSSDEWVCAFGWNLVAYAAMSDDGTNDSYFAGKLAQIEKSIHQAKNRARHSMNGAMIAIGMRNPSLRKTAIETAEHVGTVEVDHGETGCKTPDAVSYIKKVEARRSGKGKTSPKRVATKTSGARAGVKKKKRAKAVR